MTKDFYNQQDDLTAAKINFYRIYIEGYLVKLLMGFGTCFIADLFCGPGKNGKKDGSPLVLIDRAEYILTSPSLKKKDSKIHILFNDIDKKHIQNLKAELNEMKINNKIKILDVQSKEFDKIFAEIIKELKGNSIPKFFFLDPFTYSNIKMAHLHKLMNLQNSEVLLFLPTFHGYRFAGDEKLKKDHKTRVFVEEFTTKGINDYDGIDDFMNSIKEKIKLELGLDFVRPILLDDGTRKNALFLLTKSVKGMLLMNSIAFKKSEDGRGMQTKYAESKSMFGAEETDTYKSFASKLEGEIRNKKELTNSEIVNFTIAECFLPKYAKMILASLKKAGKIEIFDKSGNEINQLNKYFIAEKINGFSIFRYVT